jgi:hypothetical protein
VEIYRRSQAWFWQRLFFFLNALFYVRMYFLQCKCTFSEKSTLSWSQC